MCNDSSMKLYATRAVLPEDEKRSAEFEIQKGYKHA